MSPIYFLEDSQKCWWCGGGNLTAEHKIKRTDIESLYGKQYLNNVSNKLVIADYRSDKKPRLIQGSNSDNLKFLKNLCNICNNQRSQDFDFAYQKLIDYYLKNEEQIKTRKCIDLELLYGSQWQSQYDNVKRYLTKHIACRLAINGFKPSKNIIEFLDGKESIYDVKFVFQIKPYKIGNLNDPIDSIYIGPINFIKYTLPFFGNVITSAAGWYTFKNLSFNYIFEENINQDTMKLETTHIVNIDLVDYSDIENKNITLNSDTLVKDFGFLLEKLEFYPFWGENKEVEHYLSLKNH